MAQGAEQVEILQDGLHDGRALCLLQTKWAIVCPLLCGQNSGLVKRWGRKRKQVVHKAKTKGGNPTYIVQCTAFQIPRGAECTRATILRSRTAVTSSHRDEMENQHTVKNGLSSAGQEVSRHPFSIPSEIMRMQGRVKRKGKIKWNYPAVSSSLSPHAELLPLLISASTRSRASMCLLLSCWRQKKKESVELKAEVFVSVPATCYWHTAIRQTKESEM